ncbi:MAG: DNA alkylation repair protein [Pirellulaceae bacterium]
MKATAKQVIAALKEKIRPDKAAFLPGFFQAVPGGYGEGDKFLGVVVPDQRSIAKRFRDLPRAEVEKLLASPWHECRLTAAYILVLQFERVTKGKQADPAQAQEIVDFYLANLNAMNNWDLVDTTAPKILGPWLLQHPKDRKVLNRLAKSKIWWERRVAIVATLPLIHADQFDEILTLSTQLIADEHPLMHKAIGWMLREVGKRSVLVLRGFLTEFSRHMPRTMLRYAIEKLPEAERKRWLA